MTGKKSSRNVEPQKIKQKKFKNYQNGLEMTTRNKQKKTDKNDKTGSKRLETGKHTVENGPKHGTRDKNWQKQNQPKG